MQLMRTGFWTARHSVRLLFSSSRVFTKYPLPPHASIMRSYRQFGDRAVGGSLRRKATVNSKYICSQVNSSCLHGSMYDISDLTHIIMVQN